MSGKSALIIGATGQVGRHLLQELLQDPTVTRVGEYGRRVTPLEAIKAGKEKLVQKCVNFEKIDEEGLKDGKWDVVYITLGTTRSAAGSAAAFEKIDREYVVNSARAAQLNDPNHPQRLVYLSSGGANADSRMLYLKSKGLTELMLANSGYSETIVFRPGLLTGTNREDFRPFEHLAFPLMKLRASWTRDYSCPVETVAKAMRVGGGLGTAKLPEAIASHISKEGGASPFTAIDNVGHRVLAEITGTSAGLGKALTEYILERGHIVVATLRKPPDLDYLKAKYPPEQLLIVKLDVTDRKDIATAFDKTREVFGRLDVVVNNAGYGLIADIEDTPEDVARTLFDVDFWGPAIISKAAVKFFRDVNKPGVGGRLINVSSVAGLQPYGCIGFYSAAKYALEGFSQALSTELVPSWNIKIIISEPGGFSTDGTSRSAVQLPPNPLYNKPELPSVTFREYVKQGGNSVGDPRKAAAKWFELVEMPDPPLRLPLGLDALESGRKQLEIMKRDMDRMEDWSKDLLL
ncbi:hypothetical protein EIP91_004643 [Steccherinum ochraceum]|uniref:NAD(P)-binding domain-containing protein n=1 Tax=Steccherinum ochraceum TaxID=92696 RepID=A0A4R0RSA3_9APHY|nr:hypothetical protein EIP91_004643 [Steccherinum ochraceum]